MIQHEDNIHNAVDLVEQAAEQVVMIDVYDHDAVSNLTELLTQISRYTADSCPRCSQAASICVSRLESSMTQEAENGSLDLREVEEAVSAFQEVVQGKKEDSQLELSFLSGSDGSEDNTSSVKDPEGKGSRDSSMAVVDQEIVEAYIEQQEERLADMEEMILSYEQKEEAEVLTELRRHLHTAKGEAGAVGFNEIERVCHLIEDYIQSSKDAIQADILLTFKDWFAKAIQAISSHNSLPELPQEIIHNLQSDDQEAEKDHLSASTESNQGPDESLSEMCQPVPIEDPEITGDFISEAQEHFDVVEENLMVLENEPENEEAISAVFRAFHTIKGTTSFLGLSPIAELAHKAENLLDEVRKGHLSFKDKVVEATFSAQDMLKKMIEDLSRALSQGQHFIPDKGMVDVLNSVYEAMSSRNQGRSEPQSFDEEETDTKSEQNDFKISEEMEKVKEEDVPGKEGKETRTSQTAASNNGKYDPPDHSDSPAKSRREIKQTMKIDAERIDLLLDTIGELVIVESIVRQDPELNSIKSNSLERNLAQLTKITRGLQDMGMSMRMVPIEATFRKMARLVRDLAKKSGKEVELSMVGKETELDKAMVEKLGDPLVHMIRNAVDHGIEPSPEDRLAAGKNRSGHITLKAYHEGGSIHIEISDDGRGLDRQAIVEKALDRGVIQSADGMSEEEIYALIFEPGFSTAQKITDVSGRGVGMDVVKSNIENMRGNIRVHSVPGQGSSFTLILPLTMAIIDGMIVKIGQERYIIPLLSIIESFQPTKDMINTVTGKGETVPFRGRLLPLFRLGELFKVRDGESDPTKAIVVVVEDAGKKVALLVDELLGQNQTVIKSLGEAMGSIEGVAGASIMPDGSPGLIIDVNGVVKMATSR